MAPRLPTRTPRRVDDAVSLFARLDSNKWLIGLVFGGLINTGIMYQQFTQIKETLAANIAEQKIITSKMNDVQVQQVRGEAKAQILEAKAVTIEQRIRSLEVMFMETPSRRAK
jgi:hypothetical protein